LDCNEPFGGGLMPTVDIWEHQVMPQGRLALPSGENSLAEQFGAGLQQLGQVGGQVADQVVRADQIVQRRNADTALAKFKPQAMIDLDKIAEDLETNAKPGAPGHIEAFDKQYDEYTAKALQGISDPLAKQEASEYLGALRPRYEASAKQFMKASEFAKRSTDITSASQLWQNKLTTDPSLLPLAQSEMAKAIAASGIDAINAGKLSTAVTQDLAGSAMGGMATSRPKQLLSEIQAGKWNEIANPGDLVRYKSIAERQIEVDQAQAEQKAREARNEARSNFGIVFDDAVSTAVNTGVQKGVSDADIDRLYEGAAAETLKRRLHTAEAQGLARIEVQGTTAAEDDAWIEANKPTAGKDFTTSQAAVYKARVDAIDGKRKSLAEEVAQDLKDSADENQQIVAQRFDDWFQQASTSHRIPEDAGPAIAEAFAGDPAKRKSYMDKLQTAVDLGNQAREVQISGAAEDETAQAALDQAGQTSAAAALLADERRKAIAKKKSAFSGSDPGGAALTTSPVVADSWQAWQDAAGSGAPETQDYMRSAVAQTIAEQERQNVPVMNRRPLPDGIATSIIGQINALPTPKEKLQALMQYVDIGGDAGQSVLAQLTSMKGGLPNGTDMVIDIARTDQLRAERVLAALQADTKGVELPKEAKAAINSGLNTGLIGVLATQAQITGNYGASSAMAGQVITTAEQYAKAKVMLGTEGTAAGNSAVEDLTGAYAKINDASFAAVFYPADIEKTSPGAIEAGLASLRSDAAGGFKAVGVRKLDTWGRTVADSAVWINHGSGFALIVPGSNRILIDATTGQPITATYAEARDRGLKAIADGQAEPVNPGRPKSLPGPEMPYYMTHPLPSEAGQ
jgi:hypothetical protein